LRVSGRKLVRIAHSAFRHARPARQENPEPSKVPAEA
jgi:hypothetical protein